MSILTSYKDPSIINSCCSIPMSLAKAQNFIVPHRIRMYAKHMVTLINKKTNVSIPYIWIRHGAGFHPCGNSETARLFPTQHLWQGQWTETSAGDPWEGNSRSYMYIYIDIYQHICIYIYIYSAYHGSTHLSVFVAPSRPQGDVERPGQRRWGEQHRRPPRDATDVGRGGALGRWDLWLSYG